MGFFDRLFGGGEKKEVMHIRTLPPPKTQKEAYERKRNEMQWEQEWDSEDDPQRIEKSIDRHQKKSQKRGGGEA